MHAAGTSASELDSMRATLKEVVRTFMKPSSMRALSRAGLMNWTHWNAGARQCRPYHSGSSWTLFGAMQRGASGELEIAFSGPQPGRLMEVGPLFEQQRGKSARGVRHRNAGLPADRRPSGARRSPMPLDVSFEQGPRSAPTWCDSRQSLKSDMHINRRGLRASHEPRRHVGHANARSEQDTSRVR